MEGHLPVLGQSFKLKILKGLARWFSGYLMHTALTKEACLGNMARVGSRRVTLGNTVSQGGFLRR